MFCPEEPIIVKCSVRGEILHWHIGKTSFVMLRKDVTFYAGLNDEGKYSYLNTTVGRLNFYQNGSYVDSNSTISEKILNSELHMHLNGANDYIEVSCQQSLVFEITTINITAFPGMLNIA